MRIGETKRSDETSGKTVDYQHILASIGAPMWGRHTISEPEVCALSHLRGMDLKLVMIDEVHNLLAGSYREQERLPRTCQKSFANSSRYIHWAVSDGHARTMNGGCRVAYYVSYEHKDPNAASCNNGLNHALN